MIDWWYDLSPFWRWGFPILILLVFGAIFLASGQLYLVPTGIAVLLLMANIAMAGRDKTDW